MTYDDTHQDIRRVRHCDKSEMHVLRGFGNYRRLILTTFLFGVPLFVIILCVRNRNNSDTNDSNCRPFSSRETAIIDKDGQVNTYGRSSPLIFIGGFPRSGTTLARAMLDAHKDIRCGEETRVVPRILQLAAQWNRSAKETTRLHEAGLTDQIIADAVAAFILEVVVKHGEPAPRLCNKDPFTLKYGVYLMKIFPNAKFIFMIRDGRAVVHSLIQRKVTVTGFDLTNYRQCLTKWSNSMKTMLRECDEIGPQRCLKVKYEDLVLHPRLQMERILNYLELPWMEDVMHHEQYINKPGGVSLSKVERSSDQVIKPVNVEALSKWVGAMPDDVVQDMANIAPVLETLGYNPNENPPNYGVADVEVADNTNLVLKEADKWKKNAQDVLERSKQK